MPNASAFKVALAAALLLAAMILAAAANAG
jgi:hypothetical protein